MAGALIPRATAIAQGLSTYFTGKPCKHGHVAERRTKTRVCVACVSAYQAVWYKKNKPRKDAANRKWAVENREAVAAKTERWRAKGNNRELSREYSRRWTREYREKRRRLDKKKYDANPDLYRAINAGWVARNPEKKAVVTHRRRARKLSAPGIHTAADLNEILAAQGHCCAYCGVSFKVARKHLDHIQPLARGGSNDRANLQYLCETCNLQKKDKDPIDFARERGLLL